MNKVSPRGCWQKEACRDFLDSRSGFQGVEHGEITFEELMDYSNSCYDQYENRRGEGACDAGRGYLKKLIRACETLGARALKAESNIFVEKTNEV